MHIFSFFFNSNLVLENFAMFLHIWICHGKGFIKMYNISYLAHFLLLHNFCLITWYCNKYLKFCKFANFVDYLSRAQELSKMYQNAQVTSVEKIKLNKITFWIIIVVIYIMLDQTKMLWIGHCHLFQFQFKLYISEGTKYITSYNCSFSSRAQ